MHKMGLLSNPVTCVQDRYAEAKEQPPIDESQDWELLSGREEDGYTILQFRRDWVTCDDRDRNIDVSVATHVPLCHVDIDVSH